MSAEAPQFSTPAQVSKIYREHHIGDWLLYEEKPDRLAEAVSTLGIYDAERPRLHRQFYLAARYLPDGAIETVYMNIPFTVSQIPQGEREGVLVRYSPAGTKRRQTGFDLSISLATVTINDEGKIIEVTPQPEQSVGYKNVRRDRNDGEGYTHYVGGVRRENITYSTMTPWSLVDLGLLDDLYDARFIDYDQFQQLSIHKSPKTPSHLEIAKR